MRRSDRTLDGGEHARARRALRNAGIAAVATAAVAAAVIAAEVALVLNRTYEPVPDFAVRFTTTGETPALRMAVLGDSTVAGLGTRSERETLGGHVARKVSVATGRAVSVRGYGMSGARTLDVVERQLPQVEPTGFDVIVIEIGSNDVTHLTSLEEIEAATARMLEDARRRAPIVVFGSAGRLNSSNFLPPLRQLVMIRATAVRGVQQRVAARFEVPFVDVARDVSPAYDREPDATSADAFHPSAVGYEIWARPLARLVVAELERESVVDKP